MSNPEKNKPERPQHTEKVSERDPLAKRRFKRIANRKGRPKGAKNRKTIVRAIANKKLRITEGGKRRMRTTLQLVLKGLRDMAIIDGNVGAMNELHRLLKAHKSEASGEITGCLVVPAAMTPEEWIKEQMAKNEERDRQRQEEA